MALGLNERLVGIASERGYLIGKKFGSGLTQLEEARLNFLNAEMQKLCPRVSQEQKRALEELMRECNLPAPPGGSDE